MQANQAWIAMFRRIPTNLHDCLALGLRTGVEIVIQKVIRLDPEFMLVRGRLSGTTDIGRVLLMPYSDLTYVALTREMKDAEVEAIFGKAGMPEFAEAPTASVPEAATKADDPPLATLAEEPVPVEAVDPNAAKKSGVISKSAMIAKLRERLKEQGGK